MIRGKKSHSAFQIHERRLSSELFEDFIITLLYQTRPSLTCSVPLKIERTKSQMTKRSRIIAELYLLTLKAS